MSVPKNNLMISHYLTEIASLSSEIIRNFDEIEHIIKPINSSTPGSLSFDHAPERYFFIKPEIFTLITAIAVHSSNIKKLLFASPRKKNEAKIKYSFRVDRAKELQAFFDMDQIQEIKNSDVRNSLEHFDERLDLVSSSLKNGTINQKYHIIASNIVISEDGALVGNPLFLKCYVIKTKTYKNAEKELNLGNVYSEAKYIYDVTHNKMQLNAFNGSVIIIPPRNNT